MRASADVAPSNEHDAATDKSLITLGGFHMMVQNGRGTPRLAPLVRVSDGGTVRRNPSMRWNTHALMVIGAILPRMEGTTTRNPRLWKESCHLYLLSLHSACASFSLIRHSCQAPKVECEGPKRIVYRNICLLSHRHTSACPIKCETQRRLPSFTSLRISEPTFPTPTRIRNIRWRKENRGNLTDLRPESLLPQFRPPSSFRGKFL